MEDLKTVHALRRQQAAIATFGSLALRQNDPLKVFAEAARVCAESLGVRFCKVCQYRPAENDLLIVAGWGWKPGVVGHVVSPADISSPQGNAFVTGKPSICRDVRKDQTLDLPGFYAEHGIVSTVNVVIKGDDQPYGVLEVDSHVPREFDQHDIAFLTAFANILAESVATAERMATLRHAVEQMTATVSDLAHSEKRFRIVFDAAPIASVMFNADGRIRMANAQAKDTLGYASGELLDRPMDILVPERLRARNPAVLSEVFQKPRSEPASARPTLYCLHKDGHEFPAEIGLNSIELNGESMTLSSIVDISERTQLEAQLRQAQKMEAVGRLTAGVAHDFNNLLQTLTGGLELLLDHVNDRPSAWEYGQIALRAARRGGEVTHRLLAFSRQQKLMSRALPVRQLFDDVADLIAGTFGPNIKLTIAPVFGDLGVMADAAQLQAAIINLAMNARDAMDGNGPLTLSAYRVDPDANTGAAAGFTVIAVEDTGTGMDEATMAQACEPFFTTKGLSGSGLGLSMVQGFARQSGGDIHIVSAVGRGTRVEIWLPSTRVNKAAMEAATSKVSSGHILLVDDEADVLVTVAAFLRSSGYLVTGVENGDLALARLLSGEHFDAIVTDYAMPGLNGINLLRQVHEIDKTLPGLIITGYYELGAGEPLSESFVLRKPFSRAQLIECVDGLVTTRRQFAART
jgi:PAS domain S-box-containing protein